MNSYPWFRDFAFYAVDLINKYLGHMLPQRALSNLQTNTFISELSNRLDRQMRLAPMDPKGAKRWILDVIGQLYSIINKLIPNADSYLVINKILQQLLEWLENRLLLPGN